MLIQIKNLLDAQTEFSKKFHGIFDAVDISDAVDVLNSKLILKYNNTNTLQEEDINFLLTHPSETISGSEIEEVIFNMKNHMRENSRGAIILNKIFAPKYLYHHFHSSPHSSVSCLGVKLEVNEHSEDIIGIGASKFRLIEPNKLILFGCITNSKTN